VVIWLLFLDEVLTVLMILGSRDPTFSAPKTVGMVWLVEFPPRFLEEYESMYQEASEDVSQYLANPVNAYLLVKRLTSDWKRVEGVMTENVGSGMK
jgi:hypothetical protein